MTSASRSAWAATFLVVAFLTAACSQGVPDSDRADPSSLSAASLPAPSVMATTAPTAGPSRGSVPGSAPSAPEPEVGEGEIRLRAVDGGPDYYGKFTKSLPASSRYFPVGVWLESIMDAGNIAMDRSMGLNTYVDLTPNSDLSLLGPDGPYALTSKNPHLASGLVVTDEPDMWAGAGDSPWTGHFPGEGDICSPSTAKCGYTVMRELLKHLEPHGIVYANYGKGVSFRQTDAEAARFVNEFQDIFSVDNYWFTDPHICGAAEGGRMLGGRELSTAECRLAANYGWTIDRGRSLVVPRHSKPIWAFIEVGHPFSECCSPTITGPEIRAAVWSSVIHGARGVVYFNHSFGGDCISQHVLRDACGDSIRPWVTAVNRQLQDLAPVLNAPFLENAIRTNGGVDTAVKIFDGSLFVLVSSARTESQQSLFDVRCTSGAGVDVLDEGRSLPLENGRFADHFADGNSVHLYKIQADPKCLPFSE